MKPSLAVQTALQLARGEAAASGKPEVGPLHLLCGATKVVDLLRLEQLDFSAVAAAVSAGFRQEVERLDRVLTEQRIGTTALRHALRRAAGQGDFSTDRPERVPRSPHLRSIFEETTSRAAAAGRPEVELPWLLAVLLGHSELMVSRHLEEAGADLEAMRTRLTEEPDRPRTQAPGGRAGASAEKRSTPTLDRFGRDLTALAAAGKLGPVIGRRREVLQLIRTLARRSKNNAVLVGAAGVGKTAVVELLAQRIANGRDGNALAGCRLVEVTMSSLLAGASRAGEREARLQSLIDECRPEASIILFIDELHTLICAGGVGGSIDPADIFKPALARGEIRCIGATTADEFSRHIEADPALERRFDRINVVEPSPEEALAVLQGLKAGLEAHHGVELPDRVLARTIEWSVRFDTGHQLPDKAIDLLDQAAARTRVPALSMPDPEHVGPTVAVDEQTVAAALADKLGIPVDLIHSPPSRDVAPGDLERFLEDRLVGQSGAIARVADRLRVASAGLRPSRGPLAVFLFVGPTGVGKTEMARCLAEYLFGAGRGLIRLDMSEYIEEHSVARLTGAPPGYVGHDAGGQLTSALRATPHALVLLDEIDKAHTRVFDVFLQLFDEGRLTDARGRTVDARHALFVMTCNPPVEVRPQIGFAASPPERSLSSLTATFRPEFLARIDDVIVFERMRNEHVRELIDRSLRELKSNVARRHQLSLEISPAITDWLAGQAFDSVRGVRDLKRTLEKLLDRPLASWLETADPPARILMTVRDGQLQISDGTAEQ